uniref:Hexosyltransferase n=1 Tax=Leptobrachium leishanense TaxID=445787 RepID=A0A8C5PW09_9ANUR
MKNRLYCMIFIVCVLTSVSLITSILWTHGILVTWNKKWDADSLQKTQINRLPSGKESVNLTDGVYTYYLNITQFLSEFPVLQDYQCSLTLTPHGHFEETLAQPLLILAIKSHPASGARRNTLRQTWAREGEVSGYWVKPIFLTAQTPKPGDMEILKIENREFGDILQWDFSESHHNLSLKERCFLEWLHHHLPRVAFIFKGDDDEYVNPYAVVQYIKEHGQSPTTLHGFQQPNLEVMRHTKYSVSRTLYPFHKYPQFLSGGGFLFPGRSVKSLYEASRKIPVFPLDDVYFAFLSLASNLSHRHDARFRVLGLTFDVCQYQQALVVHGIGPERMMEIYQVIQRTQCT